MTSLSLLSVRTTRHGRRLVLTPVGELDMSTADKLEGAVHEAEETDAERILIDLTGVTFMDSSGLKLLLAASERARVDSNRLRLIRGPRRVQRVFQLTRTEEALPFID